jgi:hypothetical protein
MPLFVSSRAVVALPEHLGSHSNETVLEETAFALGAEGFEDYIDREKRLFACLIVPQPLVRQRRNRDGDRPAKTGTAARDPIPQTYLA